MKDGGDAELPPRKVDHIEIRGHASSCTPAGARLRGPWPLPRMEKPRGREGPPVSNRTEEPNREFPFKSAKGGRYYVAEQGRHVGRAGRVEITDDGRDIWVGGKVTARVRGTIDL